MMALHFNPLPLRERVGQSQGRGDAFSLVLRPTPLPALCASLSRKGRGLVKKEI
jgi:hypothetical protein